jgi:hypothetical protein
MVNNRVMMRFDHFISNSTCFLALLKATLLAVILTSHFLSNAQLYKLLENEDVLTVPFEYSGNLIILDVQMNDKLPLRFILDTGAENVVLFDRSYAEILELDLGRKIPVYGSSLDTTVYAFISRRVPLGLQGFSSCPTDILVLENAPIGLSNLLGTNIHGLLGANFFSSLPLKIDYGRKLIKIYHPDIWKAKNKKKYDSFPINIYRQKPYLTVSITNQGTRSEQKMLIDSGASLGVLFHQNTNDGIQMPDNYIEGVIGHGISGKVKGFLGRMNQMEFGNQYFSDFICAYQALDSNRLNGSFWMRNGLIGNEMLDKYTVVIDYSSSKLYLRPRSKLDKAFVYDRSGMTVGAYSPGLNRFMILDVLENSPADKAGLLPGDVLLKFQKISTNYYNLAQINNKLKKRIGKKIHLKILRNDQIYDISFRLNDLI